MRLPQRRSLVALLAALTLPAACGKKEPAPAPDAAAATHAPPATTAATTAPATTAAVADAAAAPADVAQGGAPEVAAAPVEIPKVEGTLGAAALAHIPGDPMVVWAGVPSKIWTGLGFDTLAAKFGDQLERSMGPEMWGRVKGALDGTQASGIDGAGLAGVVWPNAATEGFVAFVPLTDRAKLEETLNALGGQMQLKLTKETRGDGTLYSLESSDAVALFVTDKAAYIAFGKGADARALAGMVATTTPDKSVLANARYAKAATGAGTADAALYLDFARLMHMFVAPSSDPKRGGAMVHLLETVSGAAGTLTFSANLHDDGVELSGRLDVGDGSPLLKIIQPSGKVIPAVAMADAVPAFLLAGKLDWKGYLELAKLAVESEGGNLDEGFAAIQKELGIDVQKDLIDQLSGEVGLVATGDALAAMREGKGPEAFNGAAYLGFNDAETPKKLLGILAGLLKKGSPAGGTLKVPFHGKTLGVRVVDNYLVAATEDASFGRFEKLEGAGPMPALLGNDRLKALVERTDLGALLLLDQGLAMGAMLTMRGGGSRWEEPQPLNVPKEKKAKWDELARLKKDLAALEQKRDNEREAKMLEMVAKLGTTAEAAWVEGTTLVWHIGQYPKGIAVKELVSSFVDMLITQRAGGRPAEDPKLEELRNKIDALRSELMELKPEQAVPPIVTPKPK